MFIFLQIFRGNGRVVARKSTLLLFLAILTVFSGACSKKMPCPSPVKAEKQAKTKKKKAPKKQLTEDDGTETAEASAETTSDDSSTSSKSRITGTKNKYSKNGLLQKKKYKRLRSNPARKRNRVKNGIFSIFSGKQRSGNKAKRSRTHVESADE